MIIIIVLMKNGMTLMQPWITDISDGCSNHPTVETEALGSIPTWNSKIFAVVPLLIATHHLHNSASSWYPCVKIEWNVGNVVVRDFVNNSLLLRFVC